MTDGFESLPLPQDPLLRAWATVLNDLGYWAVVLDADWRYVFVTDEMLSSYRNLGATTMPLLGAHIYSAETRLFFREILGAEDAALARARFLKVGSYVLAETAGGRDELRRIVDPEVLSLVDELEPRHLPAVWMNESGFSSAGARATGPAMWIRIDDSDGKRVGVCQMPKPAAGMSHLARAAAIADLSHLERMNVVATPGRHPAAILMADLESSSP